MLVKRFFDEPLAQTSYLIGCGATGTAIVIDPNRLVDPYIGAAEAEGLRITAVTETHIHADFLSGTRELAARTGAPMYLSAMGPADWQYEFRNEPNARPLHHAGVITVGNVSIEAVHTPGHTPEHLSFLVTDGAVADEPMAIVTGDFVFVGDVGRPDLLEKAARIAGTSEHAARDLYRSLDWFRSLADHIQVWPGHGAGSACGKGMSAVPQSTVGYERRYNWAFGATSEAEFVRQVLVGQPEPPRYFGVMKRINREGPPLLGSLPNPERVAEHRLLDLLAEGATVIDTRATAEFAAGHLPGSLNIPLGNNFTTYAGSLLPYDRDLYLILQSGVPHAVRRAVQMLVTIGLDRVAGYAGSEALSVWSAEGRELERTPQTAAADVPARQRAGALVVDVRARSEWDQGHIEGARLIPLPELVDRLGEIPEGQEVLLHCQGGGRSAVAASLLLASGRKHVANVSGGFGAWIKAGLPESQS
ncbi:MAG: rhodanese-like domain-containing protein [Gemmatimonadota bacterium]